MNFKKTILLTFPVFVILTSFTLFENKIATVYLIGDSTLADYSLERDYATKRFPLVGWGQVFQKFLVKDSLYNIRNITKADSLKVDDRAKGGRSTRTFFQEGRWAEVYKDLKPGDIVMIQFGHNDESKDKPERYVDIPGYKDFLKLYVNQTREKGAIPILITPVARNYPWKNGHLSNVHGDYPQAVKDVAKELNVKFIDLNELSMKFFSSKGQEYVTEKYFMNLDSGKYEAYPKGQHDNTHFQGEGATEVARLVFNTMKKL